MKKYNYTQFIQAHKNKAMDYDGIAGCQCIDLCKYYLDEVFGLTPGAWGDAHCWYENYNSIPTLKNNFTRIANTPDFIPKKGDIMVWSGSLSSGGWGHVAICSGEGDTNYFYSWDNNWTGNHDATAKIKHDYSHVLGVLRPKDQTPITGETNSTVSDKTEKTDTTTAKATKVLDISEFQPNVNYKKLASEVDAVIIRVGYRGWGSSGDLVTDSMFKTHLQGVINNNIPYGFYFFSQAITATEAKAEANYTYNLIKGSNPSLPIYIDIEDSTAPNKTGRADGLTKTQRTNIINTFCKEIEAKGLKGGVYASESWFDYKFTTSKIDKHSIWVANFGINNGQANNKPSLSKYDGWQFTSNYSLSSIPTNVDMSYFYINYNTGTGKNQNVDKQEAIKENTTVVKETTKTTVQDKYVVGKEYTLQVDLKVRSGPGTSYTWLNRNQMTTYGINHSYNQTKAVFKKGTVVEAMEVKKISNTEYWIKTYSGWLCAMTNGDIYIK